MLTLYIIQSMLAKLHAGFKAVLCKTIFKFSFWLYLFCAVKKKKKVFEDFLLLSNLLHGQTCCQQQSCCRACVEKDTRTALIDVLLRAGSGYRADARSRFLMELPGQSAGPRAQAAAKINTK